MLIESKQHKEGERVVYPVLETCVTYRPHNGALARWYVPSCCFHDLINVPDQELAGMGLAIIGNLCKLLGEDIFKPYIYADLTLKLSQKADPIECPWPGMEDDRPLPLDLTKMPFETAMFLDEENQLKWRVNRIQLMHRIQQVWLPWLKGKLALYA